MCLSWKPSLVQQYLYWYVISSNFFKYVFTIPKLNKIIEKKTKNISWLDALTHLNLEAAERILTMSGHFTVDNEFWNTIISDPRCPKDYPFAYKYGKQCCKTNQELTNSGIQQWIDSGSCDGIGFSRKSMCCKDYNRVPCPQIKDCFNHDDIPYWRYLNPTLK